MSDMGFFPEESELPQALDPEEDAAPDEVKVLYATSDGWLIQTDVDLLSNLEEIEIGNGKFMKDDEKMMTAIANLIAKQEPGSWMRLPQATLVILGDEPVKTYFGHPVD